MDEEKRAEALARQYGIPYASFGNMILRMKKGENLEKIIPKSYARKELILPLFVDDDALAIAITDPGNTALLDMIKLVAGMRIRPFVSSKTQLSTAVDRSYGETLGDS